MPRNVVRFNPFAELEALQRQLLGDDVFTPTRSVGIPTTDVYTDEQGRLVVEAHLPNFSQDDIDINVEHGQLTIQAEKRQQERTDRRYVVRESATTFYRSILLPERADTDGIAASFQNGVLTVAVPIQQQPAPQRIQINVGGSDQTAAPAGGGTATPAASDEAAGDAAGAASEGRSAGGTASSDGSSAS